MRTARALLLLAGILIQAVKLRHTVSEKTKNQALLEHILKLLPLSPTQLKLSLDHKLFHQPKWVKRSPQMLTLTPIAVQPLGRKWDFYPEVGLLRLLLESFHLSHRTQILHLPSSLFCARIL